jgi:hypothetical protein
MAFFSAIDMSNARNDDAIEASEPAAKATAARRYATGHNSSEKENNKTIDQNNLNASALHIASDLARYLPGYGVVTSFSLIDLLQGIVPVADLDASLKEQAPKPWQSGGALRSRYYTIFSKAGLPSSGNAATGGAAADGFEGAEFTEDEELDDEDDDDDSEEVDL